jgi:positive regulator of sigma E activity
VSIMMHMKATEVPKLVAKSIYGIIVTLFLLLTLENHEDSAWNMIVTIILTIVSFAIAEHYATVFGKSFGERSKMKRYSSGELLSESLNMLYGTIVPVLFFVLSALGVISLLAAFDLAEAFSALAVFGYGYWYGQRTGRSKVASIVYGLINFGIVALIVWLKLSTHI